MKLLDVLQRLGCPSALSVLAEHWDEPQPATDLHCLAPDRVVWARQFAGLSPDLDAPLLATAAAITAADDLAALMAHQCRLLYEHRDYNSGLCARWPLVGPDPGLYYLLLALAVLPRMLAQHQRRGIPEEISRACCSHFTASVRLYGLTRGGAPGMAPRTLFWLRNHLDGVLIRLGRLEYMVRPFGGRLRAYRHRQTGEVVALATPGLALTPEGLLDDGAGGGPTTCLEELGDSVRGYPIDPRGFGRNQMLTLGPQWRPVLGPGDPILELHIPEGGGLTPEVCRDSMRRAAEFFPRHFPEQPFVGFACHSWILDPCLPQWLGPECNLARWQRELHLFPVLTGGRDGLYFIFGEAVVNPPAYPPELAGQRPTRLQRAILDHLAAGGKVRSGGMFLLPDELGQGTPPSPS
jgi:hypothetical protein